MPFELGSKKAVDSAVEVFKHGVETRGGVCKQLCGDTGWGLQGAVWRWGWCLQ